MKRTLSLILTLLFAVSVITSCGASTTATNPSGASSTITETGTGETTVSTDISDLLNVLAPASGAEKEHKTLETLPSSATLVGSETLPPIDNQGGVGCCVSEGVTYMQFTNAVAQYMKNNGGLNGWNPSASYSNCFSPKFTYQYAGAATKNVYDILKDHGALKNSDESFAKDASGGSQIKVNGKLSKQTAAWNVAEGMGEKALSYRVSGYEQIFVVNDPDYTVTGKKGLAMTTSEAGKAMLNKIKDAIATGNVVVTGGYPNTWVSSSSVKKLTSDGVGTLGKAGDRIITFSTNDRSGGHQVCIVGYDDDITVTSCGVTMKGAFLLANSWGESWYDGGRCWVAYDALNTESEYEDFKFPNALKNKGLERGWTLDQFCFIYWDRDIVAGLPGLYAEVEVELKNRDSLTIELTRTDRNGLTSSITPYIFEYVGSHDKYDQLWLNVKGEPTGDAAVGFFTVNFERLLGSIPEGSSVTDYLWSIKVSNSAEDEMTVKSIKVKNGDQNVLCDVDFNDSFTKGSRSYTFDFSETHKVAMLEGAVNLVNKESGKAIVKGSSTMRLALGEVDVASTLMVAPLMERNTYRLDRDDEKYGLAIDKKELKDGAELLFQKITVEENKAQEFSVSYNEDGTVTFFMLAEDGSYYALGERDGALQMIRMTELTDNLKWTVSPAKSTAYTAVEKDGENLKISGEVRSAGLELQLVVTDLTGKTPVTADAKVTAKSFEGSVKSPAASYIVRVLDKSDSSIVGNTYVRIA